MTKQSGDMQIIISDKRKISAIQKEFNALFPYLKIEFFSRPHRAGEASAKKIMKQPSQTIGESRSLHTSGSLVITPEMTVAELEEKLKNGFGLSAQVFRRSGTAWLETTVTDGWTLGKQNQQGEMLSEFLAEKKTSQENEAAE